MNRRSISWRAGLVLALSAAPVVLSLHYADAAQAPLPRERPGAVSGALALAVAAAAPASVDQPSRRDGIRELKAALDAISRERYREAVLISEGMDSLLDKRLISWLVARAPLSGLTAEQILGIRDSHAGWPEPEQLEFRAEQAFLKTLPPSHRVLEFFRGREPATQAGRIALASAWFSEGEAEKGAEIIRTLWRDEDFSGDRITRILVEFGSVLREADHRARFDRLVYERRQGAALEQAKLLDGPYQQLARIVIAALGKDKTPEGVLDAVAPQLRNSLPYQLARIRHLRRADKPVEAARILARVTRDPALLVDGDRWWEERKDLSRTLLDLGLPDMPTGECAQF